MKGSTRRDRFRLWRFHRRARKVKAAGDAFIRAVEDLALRAAELAPEQPVQEQTTEGLLHIFSTFPTRLAGALGRVTNAIGAWRQRTLLQVLAETPQPELPDAYDRILRARAEQARRREALASWQESQRVEDAAPGERPIVAPPPEVTQPVPPTAMSRTPGLGRTTPEAKPRPQEGLSRS